MTGPVKGKYDQLIADGLTPIQRWGTPEDIGRAGRRHRPGLAAVSTGEVSTWTEDFICEHYEHLWIRKPSQSYSPVGLLLYEYHPSGGKGREPRVFCIALAALARSCQGARLPRKTSWSSFRL
jgi:hypothetical protein